MALVSHTLSDPQYRQAIREWLTRYEWMFFVTLASNDLTQTRPTGQMVSLLRNWDARLNRSMFGPKWVGRPDERIFSAFFLEKPAVNPHWHGLIRIDPSDPSRAVELSGRFPGEAECYWRQLVPGGTTDVQMVDSTDGIANYITKELQNLIQYESFVVPRSFDPRAK